MPTVWIIRAASGSRLAEAFEDNGVVAIGWPDLVGDLKPLSLWQVVAALEQAGLPTPDQDADELITFRDQVMTGDLVVTPDTPNREFLVGKVTGAYEFRPSSPIVDLEDGAYRHIRTMDWWGRGDRGLLAAHLKKDLGYRRTLRRLPGTGEWTRIAEGVRDAPPKPPKPVRTPGAPRPRRAAPVPKVVPPKDQVCPRCGLRKPLTQFVRNSEVCADCRADE